MQKFSFVTHCH